MDVVKAYKIKGNFKTVANNVLIKSSKSTLSLSNKLSHNIQQCKQYNQVDITQHKQSRL